MLTDGLAGPRHDTFKFAVAYMRLSGLNRLADAIQALLGRGGRVAGAVGLDDGVTTIEALAALAAVSTSSSVFHTVSGFIYHPQLYLLRGPTHALVVVGSSNLTRDGLYRNIEVGAAIDLDRANAADAETLRGFEAFVDAMLDDSHPNVRRLSQATIDEIAKHGLVKRESEAREPGPAAKRAGSRASAIARLFPPMKVPVPPPVCKGMPGGPPVRQARRPRAAPRAAPVPAGFQTATSFAMELSAFDGSHRTGIKGTAEILVPHDAVAFFPPISPAGRKYPDTMFDVVLNSPTGREVHTYRLWYYEQRAVGTKIDEYRLRMDHTTIDLTTSGGGDVLVINRLPEGSRPHYEVTVVQKTSPDHARSLALCARSSQGKRWGLA